MERNENGYSSYNFSRGTAPRDRMNQGSCNPQGSNSRENYMQNGNTQENGMQGNCARGNMSDSNSSGTCDHAGLRLAMTYVPMQCWRMMYSPDAALTRGTMFEELDLPLEDCVND